MRKQQMAAEGIGTQLGDNATREANRRTEQHRTDEHD